jgi:hypothetical protein
VSPDEELALLQELLDEVILTIQEMTSLGETISDELQGLIADEIEATMIRIEELQIEMSQPEPEPEEEVNGIIHNPTPPEPPGGGAPPPGGPIPPLDPAPHESSNINAFKYNPENGKLYVKFQGKYPEQNGPVYSYDGVPKNIYEIFRRGAVGPRTSGSNAWHTWKRNQLPSHGAAMNALIKEGGYRYSRLS